MASEQSRNDAYQKEYKHNGPQNLEQLKMSKTAENAVSLIWVMHMV
ncbi:hypothetical protein [Staphylococcus rostri]|nr:hypothetical protein [Staphylococcus rostri]MDO5375969.1 hypothetical protein [Staphylococcus rostri]